MEYDKDPVQYTKIHTVSLNGILEYCEGAIKYYERALKLNDTVNLYPSLGWLYYKRVSMVPGYMVPRKLLTRDWISKTTELYNKSLSLFEKAIELNPSRQQILYWKANIIFQTSVVQHTRRLLYIILGSLLPVILYDTLSGTFFSLSWVILFFIALIHYILILSSRIEYLLFPPRFSQRFMVTIIFPIGFLITAIRIHFHGESNRRIQFY